MSFLEFDIRLRNLKNTIFDVILGAVHAPQLRQASIATLDARFEGMARTGPRGPL